MVLTVPMALMAPAEDQAEDKQERWVQEAHKMEALVSNMGELVVTED